VLDHRKLLPVLRRTFNRILKEHLQKSLRVELWITSASQVRPLNKTYRGKDKTTDVLSFPSGVGGLLGSIVIDLETAKIQAKEYRHSLEREVLELSVHGLFHLLGFDHENKADAERMKAFELRWTEGIKI
jgi:probable rRNA maturation factor